MNAKDRGLGYLAKRSRTEKEMCLYLEKGGFSEEEVHVALEYLTEMGYIDDDRYCREYYRYAAEKGKSLQLIEYELQSRGVEPYVIEDSFEAMKEEENIDLQEEERKRACEVAEKMAKKDGGKDASKLPGRIGRRLKALGYDSDLIYGIVGRYMEEGHGRDI